jgi:heptosyltransferase I
VKICIVKLSAMGDIIHAMVALQFIKKQIPNVQIDWIVEDGFKGVLENNPHIDNILPVNLKSLKKSKWNIFQQIKLVKSYGKNNYDVVIDAQGLIKSAFVAKIVGARIVGSKIVGFDKGSIREKAASWFYDQGVSIAYHENKIYRNAYLFSQSLGFKLEKKQLDTKKPFLYFQDKKFEFLSQNQKNILLVIGSSWESKNYPKERYLELTKNYDANFIICWGSEEEKQSAEFIQVHNEKVTITPKLSLNDLKALISKVDLLIGNDTGPSHMAWALNIPSIMLFGPTPVEQAYETNINKVIKSDSVVDHYKLNRNDFSIQYITIKEILEMTKSLLDG